MDTVGRIVRGNQKGMMIVYVALAIVALCAFVALAVDMGYMYVAKGQLQNAADAAALAGASQLPDATKARAEAVNFAAKNVAAGSAINISSSGANALASDNDITVGNWNPKKNPPYDENRVPVNAVKVRARRTGAADAGGESLGGRVDLFFAKIFDKPQMGAASSAIAQRAVRAGGYILIGRSNCTAPLPINLSPQANNGAWTSLLEKPTGPGANINDLLCGNVIPDVDVCSNKIYTTNGTENVSLRNMEADFYDPNYDVPNKTFKVVKGNSVVDTWKLIVPVSEGDPTVQSDPIQSWGYAEITIIRACGAGGGNPCNGDRKYDSDGICGGTEKAIVIGNIDCFSCEESYDRLGVKPSLVQ